MSLITSASVPDMSPSALLESLPKSLVNGRLTSMKCGGQNEAPPAGMALGSNSLEIYATHERPGEFSGKTSIVPETPLSSCNKLQALVPLHHSYSFAHESSTMPPAPYLPFIHPDQAPVLCNTPIKREPNSSDFASPSTSPDSSFNLSLISDTSTSYEEPDPSFPLSVDIPSAVDTPRVYSSAEKSGGEDELLLGLGIRGLFKKDGGAFDGLGVLSFRSPSTRFGRPSYSSTFLGPEMRIDEEDEDEDEDTLSTTFLDEAFFTFSSDPYHTRALTPISECEDEPDFNINTKSTLVLPAEDAGIIYSTTPAR